MHTIIINIMFFVYCSIISILYLQLQKFEYINFTFGLVILFFKKKIMIMFHKKLLDSKNSCMILH
jgi:Na+/alanine symporter